MSTRAEIAWIRGSVSIEDGWDPDGKRDIK